MKKLDFIKGSGNIFEDLEFSNSQDMLAKADIAIKINDIIKKKKLTQNEAAKLLNIDQPKISALKKGKLSGFSMERLFKFLNILGQDISIKISPKKSTTIAKIKISFPKIIKKTPSNDNYISKITKKK